MWETSSGTHSRWLWWQSWDGFLSSHIGTFKDRSPVSFVHTPAVIFHTCGSPASWSDISCLLVPTVVPCLPVSAHLHSRKLFWLDNIWLQFLVCQVQLPWNLEGCFLIIQQPWISLAWENSVTSLGFGGFQLYFFGQSLNSNSEDPLANFFLQWVTSLIRFSFCTFYPIIVNSGYNPYVKLSLLKLLCVSCLIILLWLIHYLICEIWKNFCMPRKFYYNCLSECHPLWDSILTPEYEPYVRDTVEL